MAVLAGFIRPWLPLVPIVLLAFMVYFFRDPERITPGGPGQFVAPADGRVLAVREIRDDSRYPGFEGLLVAIFMSPMNVHVNRAPMDGTVRSVDHVPGRFMAAFRDEATMANEHIDMVMEGGQGRILVRQIAGFVARRAVCRVRPGDSLSRGERYGLIKFSSRVDVVLPKGTMPSVKVDDRVFSGETVIGILPGAAEPKQP